MKLPEITVEIINECLGEIPIEVDGTYIRDFILNGQARVQEIIGTDDIGREDDSDCQGLTL